MRYTKDKICHKMVYANKLRISINLLMGRKNKDTEKQKSPSILQTTAIYSILRYSNKKIFKVKFQKP